MTRITVKTENGYRVLRMEGHAGAGQLGEDLVCAGISTLLLTLQDIVAEHKDCTCRIQAGSAVVQVPTAKRELMAYTIRGFRMMGKNFPEYVNIEEEAG